MKSEVNTSDLLLHISLRPPWQCNKYTAMVVFYNRHYLLLMGCGTRFLLPSTPPRRNDSNY